MHRQFDRVLLATVFQFNVVCTHGAPTEKIACWNNEHVDSKQMNKQAYRASISSVRSEMPCNRFKFESMVRFEERVKSATHLSKYRKNYGITITIWKTEYFRL